VGLDPRWEALPVEIQERHGGDTLAAVARAYEEFCCRIIDVVCPLAGVVKAQSAFFEACGPEGLTALQNVLRHARTHGLMTILDGKRNDIASTAQAYADAAFGGVRVKGRLHPVWDADALTVNPYLGRDALASFLESARRSNRGVFVLVRTSNPGAGQFQDLECKGKPLFLHVADAVGSWARENPGACGFGDVGAVVGATHPAELRILRELLPDVFFLIPGFGAQGGTPADVGPAFCAGGTGALIASSRDIIFNFSPQDRDWEVKVEGATRNMIATLCEGTAAKQLKESGVKAPQSK